MAEPTLDPNWLKASWDWLIALGTTIWGGWKYIDTKLDKKADDDDVKTCLRHIEKLFDNAEDDRKENRAQIAAVINDSHAKFDSLKTIIMDLRK